VCVAHAEEGLIARISGRIIAHEKSRREPAFFMSARMERKREADSGQKCGSDTSG
jgi:hypothetical protein